MVQGKQKAKQRVWNYEFGMLEVVQLAVLCDNYSYLLHDKCSGETVVIDPADDPLILAELQRRSWNLTAIWNTHWHADHCAGNTALLASTPYPIEVLAYSRERIQQCTSEIRRAALLRLGKFTFQVCEVPGHTLDHLLFICYLSSKDRCTAYSAYTAHVLDAESLVFCGDTLFSLGCGRLFEGSAAQLLQSLDLIASFPESSLLFCAHEYTSANLRFAMSLEKDNFTLQEFSQRLSKIPLGEEHTVPSQLGFERLANPFLRIREEKFSDNMRSKLPEWDTWSATEKLAQLRHIKDSFF